MTPDIDIWRAAHLLILEHAEEAELHAATMADRFLGWGHIDGYKEWLRIRRAIVELQAPPTGPAH